jgi:hypothetical protein
MSDSNSYLSASNWNEVQIILRDLPVSISEFELIVTKRVGRGFIVQFKNLTIPVETIKPKKINPVGLHDLFW